MDRIPTSSQLDRVYAGKPDPVRQERHRQSACCAGNVIRREVRCSEQLQRQATARIAQHGVAEGCKSWYIAESGKIVNNWSGFTFTYRRLTSRFDTVNYQVLATGPVAQLHDETRHPMPLQLASAMV